MRRRHILNTPSLAEAVKGCDTYVSKKVLKGSMIKGCPFTFAAHRLEILTQGIIEFCGLPDGGRIRHLKLRKISLETSG